MPLDRPDDPNVGGPFDLDEGVGGKYIVVLFTIKALLVVLLSRSNYYLQSGNCEVVLLTIRASVFYDNHGVPAA